MDGATRVWRLTRRDESSGGDGTPSDGSEGARTPFAATLVASVEGANDERGIRAVAMTNDDSEPRGSAALATGSYDGAATVRAWRANAETSASTKSHGGESVLSLAFSPDGAFLVTGAGDGVARVWSARADETRKNSAPLAALAARGFGAVRCVDAAPLREAGEQELMATGGEDGTIRVWSWRACHGLKTARVRVCSFESGVAQVALKIVHTGLCLFKGATVHTIFKRSRHLDRFLFTHRAQCGRYMLITPDGRATPPP